MDAGGGAAVPIRSRQNEPMRRVATLLALILAVAAPSAALAHGDTAPAPELPQVLLAWSLDPLAVALIGLAALAYLWAVRRVDGLHATNPHPRRRTAAFLGGLAAIGIALLSPIEAYEGSLFSVHMVQHLILQLVAAPLLLAGGPITLALRAASPGVRRRLLAVLQSRVVHAISFPLIAWVLFAAANWGWHFSSLYDDALENVALHYVQHATLLGAALLFWWPAIGVDPSPWRLAHPLRLFYLFLAMPQNSFLGVSIMEAPAVLYPHYVTNARSWGISPLADQELGGVLMWVSGDVAFLVAMGVVVWLWVRQEDRRTDRHDRRHAAEREAEVEAWRAQRDSARARD
jgi:putative copper resistance protein D